MLNWGRLPFASSFYLHLFITFCTPLSRLVACALPFVVYFDFICRGYEIRLLCLDSPEEVMEYFIVFWHETNWTIPVAKCWTNFATLPCTHVHQLLESPPQLYAWSCGTCQGNWMMSCAKLSLKLTNKGGDYMGSIWQTKPCFYWVGWHDAFLL
jgi:hypothetical protein